MDTWMKVGAPATRWTRLTEAALVTLASAPLLIAGSWMVASWRGGARAPEPRIVCYTVAP